MARESWTVIFNRQHAGPGPNLPFKNQTEAEGGETVTETARVAKIQAGSGQEAATAVRRAYGEAFNTGKYIVVKTSSLSEVNA